MAAPTVLGSSQSQLIDHTRDDYDFKLRVQTKPQQDADAGRAGPAGAGVYRCWSVSRSKTCAQPRRCGGLPITLVPSLLKVESAPQARGFTAAHLGIGQSFAVRPAGAGIYRPICRRLRQGASQPRRRGGYRNVGVKAHVTLVDRRPCPHTSQPRDAHPGDLAPVLQAWLRVALFTTARRTHTTTPTLQGRRAGVGG